MSAAGVMALVLFLFFLAGIGVGIAVVFAISARRGDSAGRRRRRTPGDEWLRLPQAGPEDDQPDQPPWWQARGDD